MFRFREDFTFSKELSFTIRNRDYNNNNLQEKVFIWDINYTSFDVLSIFSLEMHAILL